jgi:LysM repeat protein
VLIAPRRLLIGCSLTAVLLTAGCSVRDDETEPTATADDVFVIITPTPGTPVRAERTAEIVQQYTVKPGDSLLAIAVQFGVTLDELQAANDITNPNSIYVGQVLDIPAPDD